MGKRQTLAVMGAVVALAVGLLGISTAGAQSAEDSIEQLEAGQAVYESSCAGCHGIDGEGSPAGRPLTSIANQEPDRSVHFASVKDGKGNMPAFGERLSDDEIDSAISYLRLSFVGVEAQSGAADDSGDDSSDDDEAAAETTDAGGPEELAVTGATSGLLTVIGVSLIAAGVVVLRMRRRLRV